MKINCTKCACERDADHAEAQGKTVLVCMTCHTVHEASGATKTRNHAVLGERYCRFRGCGKPFTPTKGQGSPQHVYCGIPCQRKESRARHDEKRVRHPGKGCDPATAHKQRGSLTLLRLVANPAGGRAGRWSVLALCTCETCGPTGTEHGYTLAQWQSKHNDSTCFAGSRRRTRLVNARAAQTTPKHSGITAERGA